MAKKTRQEKELSRLRREIEILKAQKSYTSSIPKLEEPEYSPETKKEPLPKNMEKAGIQRVDLKFIKKDLAKTVILSIGALLVIATIYLLQSRIPFL